MPSSDDGDDDDDSDAAAALPKTTLNRTERVSGATFPGAVAVDGINRQQRQQSGVYNAADDDDDTLIILSRDDDDDIIPPELLLQESALQHSVVAVLAPDDDLSVRVAQRVEANLTKRLKQEVDARLSLHITQQQQEQEQQRQNIVSAEAVTIERDDDDEERAPAATTDSSSRTDHYDNFKICGLRRTCWGIILSILGIFMIGAVAGVYFYFLRRQNEKTMPPTNAPTNPPSATPTGLNLWDDLLLEIGNSIINDDDDDETVLEDPTTPQYAALDWMAKDDDYTITVLEKSASNREVVLVERYALAVLYFATNGPSSWKMSLDFLEPISVCDWNIGGNVGGGGEDDQTTTTMGVYCNTADNGGTLSVTTLHMGTYRNYYLWMDELETVDAL
jgi:hypothetical protein